jgi:hypothetical protein
MKTTQENRIEMTEEQVLNFLKDLCLQGNSIVSASIGNGGVGLDISPLDITDYLKNMYFDGLVEPCDDLKDWNGYNSDCMAYQWGDNGFRIQVLVW